MISDLLHTSRTNNELPYASKLTNKLFINKTAGYENGFAVLNVFNAYSCNVSSKQ